jgi:hypothetical protein
MRIVTLLFVVTGLALPLTASAQNAPLPEECQLMMQKMKDMHASSKAMDDRLAALVKAMNAAKGTAKIDRMAAVINELVAQRTKMRSAVDATMPQMMEHMASCPMMQATSSHATEHADHHASVMSRGAKGMGFDQKKTTHHFVLLNTGGRIEVTANDGADSENIRAIRAHLTHIAAAFASGEFALPMFIHGQTPPGVPEMKRLQTAIEYRYEEIPRGGRVVITTANPRALDAVHQFLKFQIEEHQTGDPLTVRAAP